MATKPLKTLTFEGLDDTYTVPQIDASLSTTGKAADAKATGDSLAEKASVSGMVDMAKSLVGGKYTSDKQPYHFRKSPSGGAKDEVIVGGSLGWNQLCNGSSVTVQSGHKYIAKISGAFSIGASTGTAITGLTSGTDMVIDLTAMFGSTIADYIYTLEQSNAGAGVAWVKRYIDLDTYHDYDAGSIQSVEGLVSHDVVGFNQWDEEWENGYYSSTTGEKASSNNCIRCKNKIPVIPGATYFHNLTNSYLRRQNWDAYGNFISQQSVATYREFTIPDNAHYITFFCDDAYGKVYNHDICINLSDPSRNGTYEPYEKHSYPLDSDVVLRGVPKLVTDHLEFDGDKYHADGTLERRYGVVDLGSLTWNYYENSGNPYFAASMSVAKTYSSKTCSKYPYAGVRSANDMGTQADKTIGDNGGIWLNVKDSTYTDATTFKTAMSGVMLVYELATPTTETAQPFQSPMIVGATEEYISDSVVPVGHESKYYEDVAKKVNGLPKDFSTLIAPTEITFTATRNYSVGSYLIVKNQLYKVTSAISSGGTITPNSNVTATTIMAEILALA